LTRDYFICIKLNYVNLISRENDIKHLLVLASTTQNNNTSYMITNMFFNTVLISLIFQVYLVSQS